MHTKFSLDFAILLEELGKSEVGKQYISPILQKLERNNTLHQ